MLIQIEKLTAKCDGSEAALLMNELVGEPGRGDCRVPTAECRVQTLAEELHWRKQSATTTHQASNSPPSSPWQK